MSTDPRKYAGARNCPECGALIPEFDPSSGRKTPRHKRTCGAAKCAKADQRRRRREADERKRGSRRWAGTPVAPGCHCLDRSPMAPPREEGRGRFGSLPRSCYLDPSLDLRCLTCGRLATWGRDDRVEGLVEPKTTWLAAYTRARARGRKPPLLRLQDLRAVKPRKLTGAEFHASKRADNLELNVRLIDRTRPRASVPDAEARAAEPPALSEAEAPVPLHQEPLVHRAIGLERAA